MDDNKPVDEKIKIVIVDDSREVTDYFNGILSNEKDMVVLGEANTKEEALALIAEKQPDIVLTDIQMETEETGIEIARYVKETFPDIKIIVLTIHEEDDLLFKAYAEGAMDYIVKTSSIVDIIMSIRNVHWNKMSLRPEVAKKIINEFSRLIKQKDHLIHSLNVMSKLTNAEFEILQAVYKGKSYRTIARERFVEEVTIRTQVNKILKKFHMKRMKDVINLVNQWDVFEIYNNG